MTATEVGLCDLPLLAVALPAPVRECLRAAGVPFATLDGGPLPGRRRGPQPRFVLYDSRDPGSRRDVDGLRSQDLVSIDLASCLARATDSLPLEATAAGTSLPAARKLSCPRLRELLKQTVEHAGGLWARIPEVPFPWQYDPALWNPTPSELQAWRRIRSRIRLQVARTSKGYRITAGGEFGGFRPAIELWRGRHVASFELLPGETTLPAGGLVYQQRSDRPAEPVVSARADDSQTITSDSAWIRPQSA